jgi:transposase
VRAPSSRWDPANRRGPRPGSIARFAGPLAALGVSRGRAEHEEIKRLRAELKRVEQERDIKKKFVNIFAQILH